MVRPDDQKVTQELLLLAPEPLEVPSYPPVGRGSLGNMYGGGLNITIPQGKAGDGKRRIKFIVCA